MNEMKELDRRGVFGSEEREQSMLDFEERIEELHEKKDNENRQQTEKEQADELSRDWTRE